MLNEKEKKNTNAFLIKNHFYVLELAQSSSNVGSKHLATAKQLIRKNSVRCLKNQAIFSQSKRTDRFYHPGPTVHFCSLFKDYVPPP